MLTDDHCSEAKKSWIDGRIREDQIEKYLSNGKDFISEEEIWAHLRAQSKPEAARVREILKKSMAVQTLEPAETAALLNVTDPELLEEMKQTGLAVKKKVYDNRIVTFAPLYLGNYCVNNCLYCGLRRDNVEVERNVLSMEEVRKETEALAGKIGHKRLILVYGEHPVNDIDYMVESIRTIYAVKVPARHGYGNIRRVNVNAAPLAIEDLRRLHEAAIGTYQVFQETYHPATYAKVHPKGTLKGHYRWRLYAMHRAMEAGIEDVGIGALFGLSDWKFEVMGLLVHARELEARFGVGPHTVSFPRLEPAFQTPYIQEAAPKVSDADFLKLITVIRLSMPHSGMIITARETPEIRREAFARGVTQADASTKIGVGSYSKTDYDQEEKLQQFLLGDTRNLEEVIGDLAAMGHITSFCTAGYRCNRTGECIMELLRSGQEGKLCKLNAVITFREWLDDFCTPETQAIGETLIQREIVEIKQQLPQLYPKFLEYYERTKNGERDLYF